MTVSFAIYLILYAQAQKAHVHGLAAVNLAMDGARGELEFEAPAESFVGFEHAPKTPAQKKAAADVIAAFRTRGGEFFVLPAASRCKVEPKEVELHRGQHSELHAHYAVSCAAEPKGTLTLKLFDAYKNLREVTVQYVSGTQQKSAKLTAAKPSLGL
jgi:hypothetical protein